MGAEREDTNSVPLKGKSPNRTEPGVGVGAVSARDGRDGRDGRDVAATVPEPVDFEALSAALGPTDTQPMQTEPDPMPRARAEQPTVRFERATSNRATIRMDRPPEGIGESDGRSSATYASAKPHALPKAHELAEDPLTPAVIVVQADETVPSGPPLMTTPLAESRPPSGPYAASAAVAPASQPRQVPAPALPHPAFLAGLPPGRETVRMPDRPRRAKTPTLVVRPRGPTRGQKLFAFIAMLVLFTAGGILAIMYLRPQWLGLGVPEGPPTAVTPAGPRAAPTTKKH